jgi:hypothetical protein
MRTKFAWHMRGINVSCMGFAHAGRSLTQDSAVCYNDTIAFVSTSCTCTCIWRAHSSRTCVRTHRVARTKDVTFGNTEDLHVFTPPQHVITFFVKNYVFYSSRNDLLLQIYAFIEVNHTRDTSIQLCHQASGFWTCFCFLKQNINFHSNVGYSVRIGNRWINSVHVQ